MANTLTSVLPSMLAQGVLALRQMAVLPRLVNRDYEGLASRQGAVITIPIPSAIAARAVTPAVSFAANVDSAPTQAVVTLDHWFEAPWQMSDSDYVSAGANLMPMQASEAVKALANDADSFLWGKHIGFFNASGTAGTTPFASGVTNAITARTLMNKSLAPPDNRWVALDPSAEGNFLGSPNVLQFNFEGSRDAIVRGAIGTKLGFDWYMDQNISTYTPGTGWATGFIASTVAGVIGQTTLNVLNATASGQVKIGDIFTIVGNAQQYVITVTTTVSATVQSVITFYPALVAAAATGVTLVVVSVPYVANLACHRDAFAWASRPLQNVADGGNIFQSPLDPVSGIALRLELSRQYKQDTLSYDYLAGTNFVRRELGSKIFG